jgi:hypothetical protein
VSFLGHLPDSVDQTGNPVSIDQPFYKRVWSWYCEKINSNDSLKDWVCIHCDSEISGRDNPCPSCGKVTDKGIGFLFKLPKEAFFDPNKAAYIEKMKHKAKDQ